MGLNERILFCKHNPEGLLAPLLSHGFRQTFGPYAEHSQEADKKINKVY